MQGVQPERQFKLRKIDARTMGFFDRQIWDQWQKTYGAQCFSANEKRADSRSKCRLFLEGYFDGRGMELTWPEVSRLLSIFQDGKNSLLLNRIAQFVADDLASYLTELQRWIESRIRPTTNRDRRDYIKPFAKLSKADPVLLQAIWNRWVNHPSQNIESQCSRKDLITQVGDVIGTSFGQVPLTVYKLDEPTVRFLRSRKASSPPISFDTIENRPDQWEELKKTESFPCIRHYDVRSTRTSTHKDLLAHMPCVSSLRICLGPNSAVAPLRQAFASLGLVERFDVTIESELQQGQLETLFNSIRNWPLEELSINVPQEYRESLPRMLRRGLSASKHLKRLSLTGMDFPQNIEGRLSLESFSISGASPETVTEDAIAALCRAAPRLERLEVDGENRLISEGMGTKSARLHTAV
jgi:hypothetical protein